MYADRISVESVCMSVSLSLSLCVSICVSIEAITFELLKVGASFLVHTYMFTMFRSSLSTKVIGLRSRSNQ